MIDMKAILVLDKMPKSCSECPALRWSDLFCDASGIVPTLIEDIFTRPACCPLKELPDKLSMDDYDEHVPEDLKKLLEYYNDGFNNCLTQILETED